MPLLDPPALRNPRWLFNAHLQTIFPSQFRRVGGVAYRRQRVDTPDGDFLDLDWAYAKPGRTASHLLVACHGLEGDTHRHYMLGLARVFNAAGWDVLAWNYRGCSGTPNRLPRLYHHGDTPDLDFVVRHALATHPYAAVGLAGVSLGGNLVLKYLGEHDAALPPQVVGGVAMSAPVDLAGAEEALAHPRNRIYMWRFLSKLRRKLAQKAEAFPGRVELAGYEQIRRFRTLDDRYTAPLHGFRDADDYYRQAAAKYYLAGIRRPTLLLSADNDPFLTPSCYPADVARQHRHLFLEVPALGGHVGFLQAGQAATYAELRALAFLQVRA